MKGLKIGVYLLGIMVIGLGVAMSLTNPNQTAYDKFATQQLTQYLKKNACSEAPKVLGIFLGDECESLLDKNQDDIKTFISKHTERQNYLILSVYQTDLALQDFGPLLPSYHFETIGVFGNFYIYEAVKQ